MHLALLHDYREQTAPSMRLYADRLGAALSGAGLAVDHVHCSDVLPRNWQRGVLDKLDSYLGRFLRYPAIARHVQADIVHVVDHGQAHLLRHLAGRRTVVTCHDLILLLLAAGRLKATSRPRAIATAVLRHSVKQLGFANAIVAVSENTRSDLCEFTGIDPARVHVIYPGLNYPFRPGAHHRDSTRRRLGLPDGPIVLHVGHSGFYKNLEGCLKILRRLRDGGLPVTLVRAGRTMTVQQRHFAHRLGIADAVRDLGPVKDEDLADLYRASDVFLFPSLYEGFGWPPLEAMASGLPVVASRSGSLPEVVGGAALTADAFDIGALAEHVASVITNSSVAQSLRQRGLARAQLFDWGVAAARMIEVYEAVLRGQPAAISAGTRGEDGQRSRGYRVYSLLGRDMVAVAAGSNALGTGIDLLPRGTVRASGARSILNVLRRLGLASLVSHPVAQLPSTTPNQFATLLGIFREEVKGSADLVFHFPPPSRPGRLYVHVIRWGGERVGFAKVALTPNGRTWLKTEAQALERLAMVGTKSFHVPRVLAVGEVGGLHYLLSEPLPRTARPHPDRWTDALENVSRELVGDTRRCRLGDCSWWPDVDRHVRDLPALAPTLSRMRDLETLVGNAHGDFAHWNIYVDGDQLWLIDWEFSAPDAPVGTDRVRFFLGQHMRAASHNPSRVATLLIEFFALDGPDSGGFTLPAIAFLHGRQLREATAVLPYAATLSRT